MKYNTVVANELTNGVLDPEEKMLGPLADGGRIIAHTAPGCWGPMLTPELRGGHEVTKPVYIDGAEPGDTVAISIESIVVTSDVTSSGTDEGIEGRFISDPFVDDYCPTCKKLRPETIVKGTGDEAIRCKECGNPVQSFRMENGYTIVFDEERTVGLTLDEENAEKYAEDPYRAGCIPENSIQNPVVLLGKSDIRGAGARMRPFLGQLGTTPSLPFPDSHNAGDFGAALVGAKHEYANTEEELEARTDGHMDVNTVREGAVVLCPVKVEGAGVYAGDAHAMQGNGEISGHTCDVSAISVLRVHLIKDFSIDGPIILPRPEDVHHLAKPFTFEERKRLKALAEEHGMEAPKDAAPLAFLGTGANLNLAIDNGLSRASKVLDMPLGEVKNRATFSGGIEIGRAPGVVTVSLLTPLDSIKNERVKDILVKRYL